MMSIYHKLSAFSVGAVAIALETVGKAESKTEISRKATTASSWAGRAISGLAVGLSLCLLAGGKAEAATFSFTKIADTNTPIPGGTGNFTGFGVPSLDRGDVAFLGNGASSYNPRGIYTNVGGSLNVVADVNTSDFSNLPSSAFSNPSLDNGIVAFSGGYPRFSFFGGYGGVYTKADGSLQQVVAAINQPPGSGIRGFFEPSLDNGNLAFLADFRTTAPSARDFLGIFTIFDGSLKSIASYYPGPTTGCSFGPFSGLGSPSLSGKTVAFAASGYCLNPTDVPKNAILTQADGSALQVVTDSNTPIPGGTGNFTKFGDPLINNGNIAFIGFGSVQEGIYTKIDNSLGVVADLNTDIPGGTGNFTDFSGISFDNGNLVFQGRGASSQSGIYTTLGGSLVKILASNDSLDGKIISSLSTGREALSGNQIAFKALFIDGTQGIYVATATSTPTPVPESSSALGVLAIGALGAGSVLRRKRVG